MRAVTLILALVLAAPLWAQAPGQSIRPDPRPGDGAADVEVSVAPLPRPTDADAAVPRPAPREVAGDASPAQDGALPDLSGLSVGRAAGGLDLGAIAAAIDAADGGASASPAADAPADPSAEALGPTIAAAAAAIAEVEAATVTAASPPTEQTAAAIQNAPEAGPVPEAEAPAESAALPIPPVTRVAITGSAYAPSASLRPGQRPAGLSASAADPAPQVDTAAAVAAAVAATPVPETPPPAPQVESRGLFGGLFQPRRQTTILRHGVPNSDLAVAQSLRPDLRPDGLERRTRAAATRATPGRVAQPGRRGALCGSAGLVGDRLEPFAGRSSGCGIQDPVRLRAVDGVALSTPATINCDTARALQTWLSNSAEPAVGRRGGGITSLRVVASYACRTRNSRPGARLSEHARGNAIDIAGIGLANGTEITVLTGWRERRDGRILREMHRGACGPFGTVLGPDSDRFHRDHFHFDVASYRSGPYCR